MGVYRRTLSAQDPNRVFSQGRYSRLCMWLHGSMHITSRGLHAKFGEARLKNKVRTPFLLFWDFARLIFRLFRWHPSSIRSLCNNLNIFIICIQDCWHVIMTLFSAFRKRTSWKDRPRPWGRSCSLWRACWRQLRRRPASCSNSCQTKWKKSRISKVRSRMDKRKDQVMINFFVPS